MADSDVLFPHEKIESIRAFHATRDRCRALADYQTLTGTVKPVRQIFYGDSITEMWPLAEFFPGVSLLNRGVGGDNVYGLWDRLERDVLAYAPRRVFMLIGINGIEEHPAEGLVARIAALGDRMAKAGIEVFLSGILPLRFPDAWDRFRFQDRMVEVNAGLSETSRARGWGWLDYPSALRDGTGQLAEAYACPDGTHITFAGYVRMAEVVHPHLV